MKGVLAFLVVICVTFGFFIVLAQESGELDYNYSDDVGEIDGRGSDDYNYDYGNDIKENLFQKALFNVTVNFIVPMVGIDIPKYSTSGNPLDLVYQVMFAGFGILAAASYIGLPSIMAIILKTQDYLNEYEGEVDKRSAIVRRDVSSFDGVNHEYFIDKIGLDWRECLKKSVCQAHQKEAGHHYGLLRVPFQLLFPEPVQNYSSSVSEFRVAAANGARNEEDCGHIYNCFFDVLDLGIQLTDLYEGLVIRNNLLE